MPKSWQPLKVQIVAGINSPSARSCSRAGSRSPSIARWHIRRASSSGLMVALPLLLRVIHASSKAVSRITRVSGAKDPLPIPSMFPPNDRGCQEQDLLEPPTESSRIFEITWRSGDHFQIEATEDRREPRGNS